MLIQSWWRHQVETFSVLLALCVGNSLVTGEFPSQRPVMRSFYVFFGLRTNKRLSKQSRCRWFEMPLQSLWCHCNDDFQTHITDRYLQHRCEIALRWIPLDLTSDWWVNSLRPCVTIWGLGTYWNNIASGNGLGPAGSNPLPETMLTIHQFKPLETHFDEFLSVASFGLRVLSLPLSVY